MSQTLSMLISFLAFAVAAYGIVERRQAAHAALRVRITELLSDLEALNIEEGDDEGEQAEHPEEEHGWARRAAILGRRVFLTYQILDLLARLTKTRGSVFGVREPLTTSEYTSLADSFLRCGDLDNARRRCEDALASTKVTSPLALRALRRTYARVLVALKDFDSARKNYQESIGQDHRSELEKWDAFQTCLEWLGWEAGAKDGKPEVPERSAAGQALGRSRGGPTSQGPPRLRRSGPAPGRPRHVNDSTRAIRQTLRRRGIRAVIPERADQKADRVRRGRSCGRPPAFDRGLHEPETSSNAAPTGSSNSAPLPPASANSPPATGPDSASQH